MNNNNSPSNNNDSDTTTTIWKTIHALSHEDIIRVNQKQIDLHVTSIRPNADSGQSTEITLTDTKNTTYKIHTSNTCAENPVLETPANETITITQVSPGPTQIITTHTVDDMYGQLITDQNIAPNDTYPENRDPETVQKSSDTPQIGECPNCNSDVVLVNDSAVCTGCNSRSQIEQWNTYHEQKQDAIQKLIDNDTLHSKLYLCQVELTAFNSESH